MSLGRGAGLRRQARGVLVVRLLALAYGRLYAVCIYVYSF